MTARLERHYRRAMLAYLRDYREAHADAIVATLLEAHGPTLRELPALVRSGLAERIRAATRHPAPWWADGLHLSALAMLLGCAAAAVSGLRYDWGLTGGLLLVTVLAALGRVRLALPAAALLALYVDLGGNGSGLGPGLPMGFWGTAIRIGHWQLTGMFWLPVALLAVLAALPWRPRPRGPVWIAAMAVLLAYGLALGTSGTWWALARGGVECGVLAAAIVAGAVARDARWALMGALYLVHAWAPLALLGSVGTSRAIVHWGVLAGLALLAAAASRRPVRT
ncbi:hypothetical protein [Actinomadura parmotrematis]|uniref:DUF2157 domain-containing protein n=1 Tax=Actinomadura parmotrematis TaxID=2864039 RepID=A0ABS7G2S0_9ACTN|nr:hypothetical protein [Actinomadura parmotrematis]MBW8487026.1 hypothetical protein [Actinomadura parmotrematis]